MNKNSIIILLILVITLTSCKSVKEGLSGRKQNNSDEFLVQKKSPLVVPPDFEELPTPTLNEGMTEENIEDEIMALDKKDQENFMNEIGMDKTGLSKLIKEGYDLLNLETFFTSGPEESRAWTIKKNTPAPEAAAVIHTDFQKNFIKAEAIDCNDFLKFGSAEKCKENGKMRIEGKDYIVKDGDVLYFRVNT